MEIASTGNYTKCFSQPPILYQPYNYINMLKAQFGTIHNFQDQTDTHVQIYRYSLKELLGIHH
jgi:hypothetical protein